MIRKMLAGAVLTLGCSNAGSSSDAGNEPTLGDYDPVPFGGARPVSLYVPSGYTGAPTPLVILLHGYSASGAAEDLYLDMRSVAESKSFLYAHPDGTRDSKGNLFWNATDACCNFDGSSVDDSTYLASLVVEIGTRYAVDPKRVYFAGHSNGAFMSYRMACDHADIVSGIMSLAGAMWLDTSKCKPSAPVSIVEVHGDADPTVNYAGGTSLSGGSPAYPGAATSVMDWATFDGCASSPDTSAPPIDIEANLAGAETSVTRYTGCQAKSEVDLWTIHGGTHIPGFNPTFVPTVIDFLYAHGR